MVCRNVEQGTLTTGHSNSRSRAVRVRVVLGCSCSHCPLNPLGWGDGLAGEIRAAVLGRVWVYCVCLQHRLGGGFQEVNV